LAADLGAERERDGVELRHARERFLLDCVAAKVLAIDAPYTFSDAAGAAAEACYSRRLGYKAKSLVQAEHVRAVNDVLTPTEEEAGRARRIVDAFDAARALGQERVDVDGTLVEVPTYLGAKRLLARHAELMAFGQEG
jgi:citrate lyase subunit beta / citryl-CoA lyase